MPRTSSRRFLPLAIVAVMIPAAAHATAVWVADDGEKIGRRGGARVEPGSGQPVRLVALRDEVVAFQVVVAADGGAALEGVTVDLPPLAGPRGEAIVVDRFVEHFLKVERPSATRGGAGSLGWAPGSGPPENRFRGAVPDPLIPVEIAPPWCPWPMRVAAGENGVVWFDLTVPPDQASGVYRGRIAARVGSEIVATIDLELEVMAATLPPLPIATMLFYDGDTLERRIGDREATERQLWTLFRRHRVVPLHGIGSVEDVARHLPALDGSLYTAAAGYVGPAAGPGDGIVVLGTYGTLGDPSPAALHTVEAIADALAHHRIFERADVVLYAEDEVCRSPRGAGWRALLAASTNENARRVRVGWTCDDPPAEQPVDVPMVSAGMYDAGEALAARKAGKETWIYNGFRPATGTLLTDDDAISPRTFGWIATLAGIRRWFVWETTFWYDQNRGGHGPYDPFITAETFHNADGDAAIGDGVLVYPGRQRDLYGEHSLGISGVVPSIRLKNLRRGVQDAGYLQLARGADRGGAERIARALFPRILGEARAGDAPSWGDRGQPFWEARRALAALIAAGADPGPSAPFGAGDGSARRPPRFRLRHLAVMALIVAAVALVAGRRWARRQASSKRSS